MLRTRDFALFVSILLFLTIAIVGTITYDEKQTETPPSITFTETQIQHEASAQEEILDRSSIIARLKDKIANSGVIIEQSPSVVAAPTATTSPVEEVVSVDRCLYPDDALSIVPRWPLSDVLVRAREGARLVYLEESVVVSVAQAASTTQVVEDTETVITPLLQLPLLPQKQSTTACVPSQVIGVTNGGIPMFNEDVRSYQSVSTDTLIGYARDGFPIYGVYTGAVDSCGGYDHPLGYRYTVAPERDYIIGCFVGAVQNFTL